MMEDKGRECMERIYFFRKEGRYNQCGRREIDSIFLGVIVIDIAISLL